MIKEVQDCVRGAAGGEKYVPESRGITLQHAFIQGRALFDTTSINSAFVVLLFAHKTLSVLL